MQIIDLVKKDRVSVCFFNDTAICDKTGCAKQHSLFLKIQKIKVKGKYNGMISHILFLDFIITLTNAEYATIYSK